MQIVYSPRYGIDIGLHVFATAKYSRVRDRLVATRVTGPADFVEPAPVSWDDLGLVHTAAYLDKLRSGRLSIAEIARLEIPWSEAIVEGFRLMTGGTVAAARAALEAGVSAHLGGGFHHAFAGHGEGFCMFNDAAVAVRLLQRERRIRRAAIVDCDVHHGNGTAAIFAGDPAVFTLSLHQEHNYPAFKPPSSLDVGLDDGTGDREYLERLHEALAAALAGDPDLVLYLAGADPYREDQLGGLALTLDGLRARDRAVLREARRRRVPIVVLLAGGYAHRLDDTVAIHTQTVAEAVQALTEPP